MYKDIDKLRDYRRKWYKNNKVRAKKKTSDRTKMLADWLFDYKSNLACSVCGESDFRCLDFHHTDPSSKDMSVSKAVRYGWSIARITKEINKCVVMCSNCHRKLHYRSIG